MSGVLPCRNHEALYDIVLFDEGDPAERQQAVHRAAALCAVCPRPCEQKVTTDSGPRELVLLEPAWMPPAREGNPEVVGRRAYRVGPRTARRPARAGAGDAGHAGLHPAGRLMSAVLLYPLAVLELAPRLLAHALRTLRKPS